ncbi:FAD/NAD(P)-binding domain-containing protein [Aspergillus floccosus]
MTIRNGVGPDGVAAAQSSGITVIIVGLGIAGLTAAIECHRKGHEVVALERNPEIQILGDSIALGSNATRVIGKWDNGAVLDQLTSLADNIVEMEVLDSAGKVHAVDNTAGYGLQGGMIINRSSLVMTLYEYAKALGIDMRFSATVTDFWEDDEAAGVILDGKQRIAAECVVGADGVHSKAQAIVLGHPVPKHPSGLAVFRACFSANTLVGDPEAGWILEDAGNRDRFQRIVGKDGLTLTLATGKRGQNIVWQLWHETTQHASESWNKNPNVNVQDALALIKEWPIYPRLAAVLRHTPSEKLADYSIIKRDPLPTWISSGGRLLLIGDAAHPNVPTAGQGGGQAIEDAATLAITLELAGKNRTQQALRTFEALRYKRNCVIQESGNAIYNQMREPDWKAVEADPTIVMLPRPEWIFGYDVQQDVYEEFPIAMKAVVEGIEYQPRNVLADCRYRMVHDFKERIAGDH